MKKRKTATALLLVLALCLALCGCGGRRAISYKVIAELNKEEFCIAFRNDDPLCEIITAALREVVADGDLSRLSSQYLGADYCCLKGEAGALNTVQAEIQAGRTIRIGIQGGSAPLSSARDDGTYTGLVPDLVELVMEKLGWTCIFSAIESDDVAVELGSGNVDCAWLGASLDASSKDYTLSPGWLENSHDLVVLTGSGYARMNSLKGKTLGIADSTSMDALKACGLYDKAGAVWYYDDLRSCFTALATGDCDGVVIDSIVESYYM